MLVLIYFDMETAWEDMHGFKLYTCLQDTESALMHLQFWQC